MKQSLIEEVSTGEVKVAVPGTLLVASALGSCIAVVLYDRMRMRGGMAHVMLPGRAGPDKETCRLRYAEDAIDELMYRLGASGSHDLDLVVCVAGGANVLQRQNDIVGSGNIASVLSYLGRLALPVAARDLGGVKRRRVRLDAEQGRLWCAEGNGREVLLWSCRQDDRAHKDR